MTNGRKTTYEDVHGIYGYRRITMNINRLLNKQYNHKQIYRLMKSINMKSIIRKNLIYKVLHKSRQKTD